MYPDDMPENGTRMLTAREQAIKDTILDEMDGLSHAEKRRIGDQLDPAYLEEASRAARRQQRWRKVMGIFCFSYVVALTVALGLKVGRWTPPALLLMGVVWVVMYCRQHAWFSRRLMVYRILRPLAHGGDVPKDEPESVDRECP